MAGVFFEFFSHFFADHNESQLFGLKTCYSILVKTFPGKRSKKGKRCHTFCSKIFVPLFYLSDSKNFAKYPQNSGPRLLSQTQKSASVEFPLNETGRISDTVPLNRQKFYFVAIKAADCINSTFLLNNSSF